MLLSQDSSLRRAHRNAKSELMSNDRDTAKPKRPLTPAAERALAEAGVRRAERDRKPDERPKEIAGRGGPEPTRYGDWEKDGLASDF
jgi:hypothetical protein